MSIYADQIVINEAQRRLIMRARTNAIVHDRRSTEGGALTHSSNGRCSVISARGRARELRKQANRMAWSQKGEDSNMITSNKSRLFGLSRFGAMKGSRFGCVVTTAPEGT